MPFLYLEVPCIDRALETGRVEDFFYEHNSHFSTASFCRMLDRSGARLETLGHGHDGEVVHALIKLDARTEFMRNGLAALSFLARAGHAQQNVAAQLTALYESRKRVAIWGGTGRSAAFISSHGVDRERFPIVIDSDSAKTGTYVPGAAQCIRFLDWLIGNPVDVIVVACQWRAVDIAHEIEERGIRCEAILINYRGELVDFHRGDHPYGRASGRAAVPDEIPPTLAMLRAINEK